MSDPGIVDLAAVRAAASTIQGQIPVTPMVSARVLTDRLGVNLYLKLETLHYTGAFKERGALNRLLALDTAQRQRGVIAMSAGNHAQGVAYHAARLGIPATIVMPAATPFVKVRRTERLGARVALVGHSLSEAAAHAHELAAAQGFTFVHPYADPLVIAGQGTVGLEMLEQRSDLEVVIVPVGGGGLIGGISTVVRALAPGTQVIGVQAQLYPHLYNAYHASDHPAGGHSIAEGISVKEAHPLTTALIRERVDDMVLVSESDMERAICLLADEEKLVVEGAGAAGLAAVLADPERFRGRRVGLVLCGGNIDSRLLASVLMRDLIRQGRISRLRIPLLDSVGELALVTRLIASNGGNIVEVHHQRLMPHLPAKDAALEVTVEVRDAPQMDRVVEALGGAGYSVERL